MENKDGWKQLQHGDMIFHNLDKGKNGQFVQKPVARSSTMTLEVPGGILYRTITCNTRGLILAESICFVPTKIQDTF